MSTRLSAATRATPAPPAPAITRVRRLLALLGLAVALAFYAELLAHAPATGQDFRNFYAAATMLRHGGNPYDVAQLVRAENRLYGPTTAAQRRDFAHNPYVQGPLLAVAFTPFVGLPPSVVYKIYALLLAGALVVALVLLARLWPPGEGTACDFWEGTVSTCFRLGCRSADRQPNPRGWMAHHPDGGRVTLSPFWHRSARRVPCDRSRRVECTSPPGGGGGNVARRVILLAASPIAFAGILLGQPDAVLALLLILSLWGAERGRWMLAGFLLLAVGLIKPQIIAGPAILLALPAWRRGGLARYALGLCCGAIAFAGAGLLAAGPAVMTGWLRGLAGFGAATIYAQVDVSSLSTLYAGWAPHGLSVALALLGLAGWVAMLAVTWPDGDTLKAVCSRQSMASKAARLTGVWGGRIRVCVRGMRDRDKRVRVPVRGCRGYAQMLGAEERAGRETALVVEGRAACLQLWERGWLALGLTGWLLVTPYAHPHDDVLLLPAAWYLLDRAPWRRGGDRVALLLSLALAVAWWLCPLTSLLGLRPPLMRGLGIVPILLLLALLALIHTRAGSAAPHASNA